MGKQLLLPSPHETKFIAATVADSFAPPKVVRLIYDRAADSNPWRQQLADRGIQLIAPETLGREWPVQDKRQR